jgi:hypothetical protein
MQSPLEIAFHGLQSSPALEVDIRQQVDKLERHCKDLVSCRVTVEASGGKGLPNHHVSVHIQLGLSGRNLDISRDPNHGKDHRAHPGAHSAVHDAFRVAAQQVQDLKA